MNKFVISTRVGLVCAAAITTLIAGCAAPSSAGPDKTLIIRWQRLVGDAGDTCGRCGDTEGSLNKAQRLLTASMKPLGLRVRVIKSELTAEQFKLDTSESNRIWIGDETIETILGAKAGATTCAGVCGGSPCRTTVVDGQSYESIPPELIVRAGLRVAADMVLPAVPPGACGVGGDPSARAGDPDLQPMPWLSR